MQTPETDQAPSCEQCGAPILNDSANLGCVHCLLRAGMESPEAATLSPTDLGTRNYQHYEVLVHSDGSPWELGRGAMGVTYKAIDVNLRVPVALKVVNGRFSARPGANRRFLGEAQAAARLRHPNVASVFHFGWVNTLPAKRTQRAAIAFTRWSLWKGKRSKRGSADGTARLGAGSGDRLAGDPGDGRGREARTGPSRSEALQHHARGGRGRRGGCTRRRAGEAWVKVIDFGLAKLAPRQ